MLFTYHNTLIKSSSIISLLIVSQCVGAQSLTKVIKIAKQQSVEAQIATMKFQHSELSYLYYKAGRKPLVSLSATPVQYSKDVVQRYSYNEDRTYYRTQNSLYSSSNIRLTQNVDFLGGYIYIDSDFRLYKSLGENRYKQFTTIPLRIGYAQSIVGYNAFKWQKRTERLSYFIAKKELLHSLEDVAADAVEKFIAVEQLKEEHAMAESNLRNCDVLCIEAERKLQYGRINKKDYTELQLERSKAHSAYRQANISLMEAESMLKRLLNFTEDAVLDISMQDIIQRLNHIIDIPMSDAIQYALENSTDILVTEKETVEAGQNADRQRAKRYLDATVNVNFGLHQISESLKGSYKKPLDEQAVSISLSIPLADFGRSRILHSQIQKTLDLHHIRTEKAKNDVRELIRQSVLKHSILYDMIENSKETYRLSCITYEETLAEYHLGRWRMNSLGDAVSNRQKALIEYYSAIRDYLINYFHIRNMTLYDFENNRNIENMF